VFISLWRNRTSIEIESSLESYVFTALKYAIIKLVTRRAKKGVMLPLSVETLEHTELTPNELLLYKELKTAVANKVKDLPERMQEVYNLSRVEHLSTHEIAQRLNLSEQTVKNTLSTAMRKLREGLGHYSCWIVFFI
jgi:RNA polymerase sigma-70 factor (ECF subfamily)